MYQYDSPALKVEKKGKKIRWCQITKSLKIIKYAFFSVNKVLLASLLLKNGNLQFQMKLEDLQKA